MATILIRNLDDAVAARLKLRAGQRGVSMEEEARRVLDEGTKLARAELIEEFRKLRARQKLNKTRAVDLIREDRDNR